MPEYNLAFEMLDQNQGSVYNIGDKNCFIDFEFRERELYIHYFICQGKKGAGKIFLDKVLKAFEDKGRKVTIIILTAAGLDNDKRKKGKTDADLYANYEAMGFLYAGEGVFIGYPSSILNAHEDREAGFESSDKHDPKEGDAHYNDLLSILDTKKVKTKNGGSKKKKRKQHKKTKKRRKSIKKNNFFKMKRKIRRRTQRKRN